MAARAWCFTFNNHWAREPIDPSCWPNLRYAVYQEEIGENGTPHLQGYCEFNTPKRLSALKEILPEAHWERRRGTRDQARAYCMKDDTRIEGTDYQEIGDWSGGGQGARTELAQISQMVLDGATEEEIALAHPGSYMRYYRGINQFRLVTRPTFITPTYTLNQFSMPDFTTVVGSKPILLYGESGTGKTQFALAHFKTPLLVRHMDALAEFNSKVHDGIVFDDMSFLHMPVEARIHLLDMEEFSDIHIRYRTARIPAHTPRFFTHNTGDVFWTSTPEPNPKDPAQLAALVRRVEIVGPIQGNLFQ